ncbi:siderophore ABC transporter substrate-binding protein [Virgibacillus halophilus]|uniref:Siderophore ABC transporter substrate-binding protein n=1 Tax=Tigheibacillus halophilus TaxID=361280 RepID=A0ABU5C7J1_9BACI|nr:siderophore ABC transporter substrate-binding protein [Virgibacillus halophilus]
MKKLMLFLFAAFIVIALSACGSTDKDTSKNGDKTAEAEKGKDTITVKHELGETKVPKNPKKVVVFDFGILDTFDKLGIKPAGIAQKNVPDYLKKYKEGDYTNIGSLKEPDFEAIANLDPDLIIISGRQSSVYDQLSDLAPTIYLGVNTDDYMNSFKENTKIVGEIFGKEDEVKEELAKVDDAIKALHEKAEKVDKDGLLVMANDDKMSAFGSKSRFGIIHDVFGIKPTDKDIEASTHGMNVSSEYIMKKDPSILYVIDRGTAIGEDSSAKKVVENKLVRKTKAYKDGNIVYLKPDIWYLSGGGLESVSEMISEIDKSLDEAE